MILLKKYWISTLFVIIIIVLCFINPSDIPVRVTMPNFDKLVHFLMFFGLSGVIFFDSSSYFKKRVPGKLIFWESFVFPIVLGGLIEIFQEYLPIPRRGDWVDFWFDMIGVLCGYLICLLINRRLKTD